VSSRRSGVTPILGTELVPGSSFLTIGTTWVRAMILDGRRTTTTAGHDSSTATATGRAVMSQYQPQGR